MPYLLVTLGVLVVAMLTASALRHSKYAGGAVAIYVAMFFYAAVMGGLYIYSVT